MTILPIADLSVIYIVSIEHHKINSAQSPFPESLQSTAICTAVFLVLPVLVVVGAGDDCAHVVPVEECDEALRRAERAIAAAKVLDGDAKVFEGRCRHGYWPALSGSCHPITAH